MKWLNGYNAIIVMWSIANITSLGLMYLGKPMNEAFGLENTIWFAAVLVADVVKGE